MVENYEVAALKANKESWPYVKYLAQLIELESNLRQTRAIERKVIVEPVFGQIKNGGFRGFSLRGKEKVAGEFSLVCAGHNIKKMVKAIMTGAVCPAFG